MPNPPSTSMAAVAPGGAGREGQLVQLLLALHQVAAELLEDRGPLVEGQRAQRRARGAAVGQRVGDRRPASRDTCATGRPGRRVEQRLALVVRTHPATAHVAVHQLLPKPLERHRHQGVRDVRPLVRPAGPVPLRHAVHHAEQQPGHQPRVEVGAHVPVVDGRLDQGREPLVELAPPRQRPPLGVGVAAHPQQQRDVGQLGDQHLGRPPDDVLQPPYRRVRVWPRPRSTANSASTALWPPPAAAAPPCRRRGGRSSSWSDRSPGRGPPWRWRRTRGR